MLKNVLKSKFLIIPGVVILLLTLLFLVNELQRKYQIRRMIRGLEQEISAMESKNRELLGLADYFKTSEFRERQARTLLNLQKPGEFVVALPDDEEPPPEPATQAELRESNWVAWWKYFFAR